MPGARADDGVRIRGSAHGFAPLRDRARARAREADRVVEEHDDYAVVQKREDVKDIVERTDPGGDSRSS